MKTWNTTIVVLLALTTAVVAQNPIDALTGSVQEQANTLGQQLQQKAAQHIVEGNLTQEHISKDLNTAKEQLRKEALEQVNQGLNVTSEQLEQKAKEELKNQLNQNLPQQPGFEYIFALASIFGTALILRRMQ